MTTTNESHPHVTASIASALRARLPSFSAIAIFRCARYRIEGIAANATMKPGHENSCPCRVQRPHSAATVTYAAKAKSNPPAIRLAARSASPENARPWRSSTDNLHIKAPADASSITLSSPNAIKTRLPAAMPDVMAMTASTLIQTIVTHSSLNASRIRASRWMEDLGGSATAGGAQRSSAQTFTAFLACTWVTLPPLLCAKHTGSESRKRGRRQRPRISNGGTTLAKAGTRQAKAGNAPNQRRSAAAGEDGGGRRRLRREVARGRNS